MSRLRKSKGLEFRENLLAIGRGLLLEYSAIASRTCGWVETKFAVHGRAERSAPTEKSLCTVD